MVRSFLLAVGVADGRTASLPMLGVGKGRVGAPGVCAVHSYSCDSWCVATKAWEVGVLCTIAVRVTTIYLVGSVGGALC